MNVLKQIDRALKKDPLLPCPFCAQTEIRLLPQLNGFSIDCTNCRVMMRETTKFPIQVIIKWNKRNGVMKIPN